MASCEQCEKFAKSLNQKMARGKVAVDLKKATQQHYLEMWMSAAEAMRQEEAFTDVVLVCNDKEFPAHRVVLGGASPYFRAMLQTPMSEATTGKIELKTLSSDVFEVVFHFIYTGHVNLNCDPELLSAVMESSHMLQIEALFDYTIQRMAKKLSSEYFVDIWNTAEFYSQTELLLYIKQKLADDFETVSMSNDFLNMTAAQLQELLVLTSSDFAELMLKAVLKWTKEDEENRTCHLASILKYVNVNFLSELYLKELCSSEPLVQQNQEVSSLLLSASLQYLCKTLPAWSTTAIKSNLLCFAKHSGISRISVAEPTTAGLNWAPPTVLPFALTKDMSAVGYNGDVYFIGCRGTSSVNPDEVWKYSPTTNTYSFVLQLRIPVSAAVVIDLLGFIYVIGGFETQSSVPIPAKSVQRLNPITNLCDQVSSTLEAHWFPVVGQLLGYLYLLGNTDIAERYDPNFNQWTKITPLPTRPFACASAFGEGKCYVMPDKRNPKDFLVYNPNANQWETLTVNGPGPVQIKGRWTIRTNEPSRSVMLVQDKSNDLYCFNPGCNSWQLITPVSSEQLSLVEFCIVSTYKKN